ncbi:COG4223 family protein [Nioella sp.]|uniref:COG4223 family protein n=1 Tax=Nioella sp. TaxID=1912091 RepID=UPI003B51B4D3
MADPNTTPQETDETQDDAALAEAAPDTDETVTDAEIVEEPAPVEEPSVTEPAPQPSAAEPRRGPGFVPLVLGGVVAAGLGYGAAFMGFAPTTQDTGATETALAAIQTSLDEQAEALSTLTTRASALEGQIEAIPPAPEAVDLGPLSEQIAALGTRIDATGSQISGLTDRIAYLETLPLGEGGEGADNSAAVAAAVAQLQAALQEQSASLAEQQAANAAMAEQLAAAATAAEDRIAAAEARAEARVGSATAQAALGQLRIAVATGAPFAGALADVADGAGVDMPEALTAAAETGVPTMEELQSSFPAAARAALPIAIRETAGEGAMNRVTAFLQSQVGGRSLEPQEGDGADAVLSRAEAALRAGDLSGTVAELETLPADAQAVMADWMASAQMRLDAMEAMDSFAAALDAAN